MSCSAPSVLWKLDLNLAGDVFVSGICLFAFSCQSFQIQTRSEKTVHHSFATKNSEGCQHYVSSRLPADQMGCVLSWYRSGLLKLHYNILVMTSPTWWPKAGSYSRPKSTESLSPLCPQFPSLGNTLVNAEKFSWKLKLNKHCKLEKEKGVWQIHGIR